MRGRMGMAAALAACMAGVGSGVELMQEMLTPRVRLDDTGPMPRRRGGRNRRAHNASFPARYPHHNSAVGCGAKQCRKYARQKPHGDSHEYDRRMAWNERNAHVIAKREADQARAASEQGGRNRVLWGRR